MSEIGLTFVLLVTDSLPPQCPAAPELRMVRLFTGFWAAPILLISLLPGVLLHKQPVSRIRARLLLGFLLLPLLTSLASIFTSAFLLAQAPICRQGHTAEYWEYAPHLCQERLCHNYDDLRAQLRIQVSLGLLSSLLLSVLIIIAGRALK